MKHGYVIIVPEAQHGNEVTAEIEDVRENVPFATIVGTDQRTVWITPRRRPAVSIPVVKMGSSG